MGVVGKMRQLLAGPAARVPDVPFQIVCPCGRMVTGRRQRVAQVLPCAGCGRRQFVLPLSPLPPVVSADANGQAPPAARRRVWLVPFLSAAVTLAVVVGGFVLIFPSLFVLKLERRATSSTAPRSIFLRTRLTSLSIAFWL